jgi:alkaline phosphatase
MWIKERSSKKTLNSFFFILLLIAGTYFSVEKVSAAPPKNLILMIGDGMGYEIIKAAGMYANGDPGTLTFESLPYHTNVNTLRYDGTITGSSEAATAMATGHKVGPGAVSVNLPGDGKDLKTILEVYKDQGKMTGIITTDYLVGGTPSCFGAHIRDRDMVKAIYDDFLKESRPNVLMGGGGGGAYVYPVNMHNAGYLTVADRWGLALVNTETTDRLAGIFGTNARMQFETNTWSFQNSYPHLSEMAQTTLNVLDNDPDGFFLMIEGGLIDGACHSNTLDAAVKEVVEFSNTVQTVLNWAQQHEDTLILVTADHETAGPIIEQNNGKGIMPTVTWTSTAHTANPVGLWGIGPYADLIGGEIIDNTEIFNIMMGIVPGDANGDGIVDVGDLGILAANYGMTSGATRTMGDFNGDGLVDTGDLGILAAKYGYGTSQGIGGGELLTINTPEPATLIILLVGLLGKIGYRRLLLN